MGYIYEKVKAVLSSNSNSNGGHVISNWSPNMYRCIIIGPSFIFVAKHIGVPQIIDMDMQKVKEDLIIYSKGSGRGALHNLLAERQLSCLEEIYIDNCYKPFTNLIDLEYYIGKVKNSISRLRYYGYCVVGSAYTWLVSVYQNCDVLYSLAKDSKRIFPLEYKEVGVTTWYKNYNLRPMYYKMDSDRGQLAIYFRKNEGLIEDALQKIAEEKEMGFELSGILFCVDKDLSEVFNIARLLKVINYMNNPGFTDASVNIVFSAIKSEVKRERVVSGLTKDKLTKALSSKKLADDVTRIQRYYDIFRVVDKDGRGNAVDISKYPNGFLDIGDMMDNICMEVCQKMCSNNDTKIIAQLNLKIHEKDFPKGKLSDKYFKGNTDGKIDGYFMFLSEILGVDIETL